MIKSFAALSVTTGARLLTGLILFVLLAREWPAAVFGEFMYLFSVAALLVLACEFGFTQQILREIGKAPSEAASLMGRYLGAKIWLTVATSLATLAFVWLTKLSPNAALQLALLLVAASLMSYGDFFMACFRARGRFGEEAWLSLGGNLLFFSLATGALYLHHEPIAVAAGMAFARLLHFISSYLIFRRGIPERLPVDLAIPSVVTTIKSSSAYGADVAVGAAFLNADTVLIAHTMGTESVGLYQAVARLYQGAIQVPAILGSIFLPRLARDLNNPDEFSKQSQLLARMLIVFGIVGATFFIFHKTSLSLIYTEEYINKIAPLAPWFGPLLFARFATSIYGIILTALGKQAVRVFIYVLSLTLVVTLSPPLMRTFGEAGMAMVCAAAYAIMAILFAGIAWRNGASPPSWKTAVIISISISFLAYWTSGIKP